MSIPEFPLSDTPPAVPLIPVSMKITTDTPSFGWWKWHLEFDEESFAGRAVIPWRGENRRHFSLDIAMSDVFDPITELYDFCYHNMRVGSTNYIEIYEETRFVYLQRWILSDELVQFRAFSEVHHPDFQYDFVLNREEFLTAMQAAWCEFGARGGWGFTDWATYGEDTGEELAISGDRHERLIDKGVLLILDSGKLFCFRIPGQEAYQLPCGIREGDEPHMFAIAREFKKLFGADIPEEAFIDYAVFHAPEPESDATIVRMTCLTATYADKPEPVCEDVRIAWLTYADRMKVSPLDRILFEDLYQKGLLK